jgi:hypothetical protein
MKAPDILKTAAQHMERRAKQYDRPEGERSIPAVVDAFNVITGKDLTPTQGWLFMVLLKLVRAQSAQGLAFVDSVEDAAAYAALMGEEGCVEPFKVGDPSLKPEGPLVKVPMGIDPMPLGATLVASHKFARDVLDRLPKD